MKFFWGGKYFKGCCNFDQKSDLLFLLSNSLPNCLSSLTICFTSNSRQLNINHHCRYHSSLQLCFKCLNVIQHSILFGTNHQSHCFTFLFLGEIFPTKKQQENKVSHKCSLPSNLQNWKDTDGFLGYWRKLCKPRISLRNPWRFWKKFSLWRVVGILEALNFRVLRNVGQCGNSYLQWTSTGHVEFLFYLKISLLEITKSKKSLWRGE